MKKDSVFKSDNWQAYLFPQMQSEKEEEPCVIAAEKRDDGVIKGEDVNSVGEPLQDKALFEKSYQQGISQGKEEGVKKGFEQGFVDGYSKGQELAQSQHVDLANLISEVLQWKESYLLERKDLICELIKQVSEKVLQAELSIKPEHIKHIVEQAVALLPDQDGQVNVQLNADDLARIQKNNLTFPDNWRLEANTELPLGGGKIITSKAEVDVSLDVRLSQCLENITPLIFESITSTDQDQKGAE